MNRFFLFFLLLPLFSYKTPFAGDDIFFGDSITFGNELGNLQYTARWSKQYTNSVSSNEYNYAASGASMIPGLVGGRPSFNINDVPPYQISYNHIFVSYWVNDYLYGATPTAFANSTLTAVNGIIAKGWPAHKIVLCFNYLPESGAATWPYLTHAIAQQWLAALRGVQQQKKTSFLDFYTLIYNRSDKASYSGDGIHPTAAWNAVMKDYALTNIEAPSATLPVSLTSFSCRPSANQHVLHWTVAQEKNVQKYEIERSEQGTNWTTIGEVGGGNSGSAQSYSFTNNVVSASKCYYRLKITGHNGQVKYSQVIIVKPGSLPSKLTAELFPNPAGPNVNLLIKAMEKREIIVSVVDPSGCSRSTKKVWVEEGVNTVTLNTSNLASGNYFVRIINTKGKEEALVKTFVK